MVADGGIADVAATQGASGHPWLTRILRKKLYHSSWLRKCAAQLSGRSGRLQLRLRKVNLAGQTLLNMPEVAGGLDHC